MIDILLVSYAIFMTFFVYTFLLFGFIGCTSLYFYLTRITNITPDYWMMLFWGILFCLFIYQAGLVELVFTLLFYYIIYRILVKVYNYMFP